MIRKDHIVIAARALAAPRSSNEESMAAVIRSLAGIGPSKAPVNDFVAAIEAALDTKGSEVEKDTDPTPEPDPEPPVEDPVEDPEDE